MKRLIPMLLAVIMVLCACAQEPTFETRPATQPATTEAPTETTGAFEELPTEDFTVAPTEPAVVIRHPLNGSVLEETWTGRPGAVVINNLKDCLPHYGTSQADILYEVETESGITRMLAVFDEFSQVETLGPVRSSRTFFNSLAYSYDAPIFHCGGSVRGRNGYHDYGSGKISGWEHVDQTYNGAYFFRDENRYYNQGYNWEHTLFTNGELLAKAMADKDFAAATERSTDFGLQFAETVTMTGEAAATVEVTFRGGKTTTFTYDEAAGLYKTAQHGGDYIDAGNQEHVSFRNVIVLFRDQYFAHDGEYSRSYYDLVGSGEGILAIDGQMVSITWVRENLESPFVYTLSDGTEATLGVGHTYVAVSGASEPVSAE